MDQQDNKPKEPASVVEKFLVEWINKRLPAKIGGITFYPPGKEPQAGGSGPTVHQPPVTMQRPTPPVEVDPMAASRRSDIIRIVGVVVLGVLVYGAYRYFVR